MAMMVVRAVGSLLALVHVYRSAADVPSTTKGCQLVETSSSFEKWIALSASCTSLRSWLTL
jgi:hypothetical protein